VRSADAHDETEVTITSRNEDIQLTDDEINRQISIPQFTANDYMADPFFKTIYNYLQNDMLTGDEQTDRKTLLLSENYYIQNELLIKLHLPRGRKNLHAQSEIHQICVPSKYTNHILKNYHEILGHFSAKRLYPSLQNRFYWRTMAVDASKISKYCDVCQRSKILTNPNKAPLHPLPVPTRPYELISFDHKVLTRKTSENNTHLLIFVDHFSGEIKICPVPSETAYDTAKVFVREIICRWSCPSQILSDKAPGFMSKLFETISKLLGLTHRFSAALAKRTNGKAEAAIKKVNNGLRLYSTPDLDDRYIELIIPLIELSLNASADAVTKLSPFKICHGFDMKLPTMNIVDIPEFVSKDANNYVKWLQNSIKLLHQQVYNKSKEHKQRMKENYDARHRACNPRFKVGDLVLLKDTRVPSGSERVLTRKPYSDGPFIITEIVANEDIGPAYKIANRDTGKLMQRLITHDRLKVYLDPEMTQTAALSRSEFTEAQCIVDSFVLNGRRRYLVLFLDGTVNWCQDCNVGMGLLIDYYRMV